MKTPLALFMRLRKALISGAVIKFCKVMRAFSTSCAASMALSARALTDIKVLISREITMITTGLILLLLPFLVFTFHPLLYSWSYAHADKTPLQQMTDSLRETRPSYHLNSVMTVRRSSRNDAVRQTRTEISFDFVFSKTLACTGAMFILWWLRRLIFFSARAEVPL
jgi:hypothetical protein